MQGLISNLIRPFRFRYSLFDLGSKINDKYERQDGSLLNDRGFRIQYSYYHNKKPTSTCLVYAHCNSGSRIEGLQFVQPTMDQGWNLCLFDFAGSGISEGEYISLGYYEWMDLQAIISMMLKKGNSKIHLWGRSMGAATIVLYLSETKQRDTIVSCVLDSPYCSLWRVIKEFGKSKTKIPQFIVEHVMEYLRTSIFKDHRFDIKQLELVKKIHKIDIPIMFIASTSDSFVNYSHAAELYKWAPNKHKVLQYIQKQHNSPRQSNTVAIGLSFMAKSISQKQQNQRQLRILSKKKELCRKMNGHNMAQLITKPNRTTAEKNHINSTGNLGRFSSFCLNNNNDIIIELSPKCQKNGLKKQNPHKIQQSIIKLTLPPKQMLQQIRKANHKSEQSQNMMRSQIFQQSKTKKQNIFSLNKKESSHNSFKNQKQNNQNVSNKSEFSQEQKISKGGSGIKNFNSIIAKKFNFDNPNYQERQFEPNISNKDKLSGKDKKNKTQKINIYLKNAGKGSPTKASKPSGIKVFKKISGEQPKRDHENLNKSQCREQQKKGIGFYNIKERVKTQAARITKQSFSSEDYEQQILDTNQKTKKHYFSQSQMQNENTQTRNLSNYQRRARICGQNPLCKPECSDSSSKQVYLNKYRDSERGNSEAHEKISYNETWNIREKDIDLIPTLSKTQLKHFQSIGDISNYDCNQFDRKEDADILIGKQRIIKIQLDKNIFKSKQALQKNKEEKRCLKREDNSSEKQNQGHTNRISLSSTQNVNEINPISKFKLKSKKYRKIQCQNSSVI